MEENFKHQVKLSAGERDPIFTIFQNGDGFKTISSIVANPFFYDPQQVLKKQPTDDALRCGGLIGRTMQRAPLS